MNALIENLKSTLLLLARLGWDLRGVFCLRQNACAVLRDCVPSQRADDSVTVPPVASAGAWPGPSGGLPALRRGGF